jgi:predicted nucleic acid-binding protein
MIVVDASAAIRWFVAVTPDGKAYPLPRVQQPLVAPDLFLAEIRSTALSYLRKRMLKLDQVKEMITTIDRLVTGYFPLEELTEEAWNMALEFDHSVYDCFYLALAVQIDSYLVTADEHMLRKFAPTKHAKHMVHGADWKP